MRFRWCGNYLRRHKRGVLTVIYRFFMFSLLASFAFKKIFNNKLFLFNIKLFLFTNKLFYLITKHFYLITNYFCLITKDFINDFTSFVTIQSLERFLSWFCFLDIFITNQVLSIEKFLYDIF